MPHGKFYSYDQQQNNHTLSRLNFSTKPFIGAYKLSFLNCLTFFRINVFKKKV